MTQQKQSLLTFSRKQKFEQKNQTHAVENRNDAFKALLRDLTVLRQGNPELVPEE